MFHISIFVRENLQPAVTYITFLDVISLYSFLKKKYPPPELSDTFPVGALLTSQLPRPHLLQSFVSTIGISQRSRRSGCLHAHQWVLGGKSSSAVHDAIQ